MPPPTTTASHAAASAIHSGGAVARRGRNRDLLGARGQPDPEQCALADFALHLDTSAVRLDDVVGDRESEAGAGAPGGLSDLVILVEDVWPLVVGNSAAGVRHLDDD